jgi:hypothetical protein
VGWNSLHFFFPVFPKMFSAAIFASPNTILLFVRIAPGQITAAALGEHFEVLGLVLR